MARQLDDFILRAVNPLLVLSLFVDNKEYHQQELTEQLRRKTKNEEITMPYYVFSQCLKEGYLRETEKKKSDGRSRKFYMITDKGHQKFLQLKDEYTMWNIYITNAIE